MQWHYENNRVIAGPVEENEAVDLIKSGRIVPNTLVWNETMSDWKPACETELATWFSLPSRKRPPPLPPVLSDTAGESPKEEVRRIPRQRGRLLSKIAWVLDRAAVRLEEVSNVLFSCSGRLARWSKENCSNLWKWMFSQAGSQAGLYAGGVILLILIVSGAASWKSFRIRHAMGIAAGLGLLVVCIFPLLFVPSLICLFLTLVFAGLFLTVRLCLGLIRLLQSVCVARKEDA